MSFDETLLFHLMQNWSRYSLPTMEEVLYETTVLRKFLSSTLMGGCNAATELKREQHDVCPLPR
jgi:hypothetical protein